MNKNSTTLLFDYLKDKTDLRLGIFVQSLNYSFKLNKSNKNQIKLLIEDFAKDNTNKARLKNIELFISGSEPKQKKVTVKSSIAAKDNKLTKLLDPDVKDEETILLLSLHNQLARMIKETANSGDLSKEVKEEMYALRKQISEIELKRGDIVNGDIKPNAVSQQKTELCMLRSFVGDWNKPGTIGYTMIHGDRNQFRMVSLYHPGKLLELLETHSGQRVRKYNIVSLVAHFGMNKKAAQAGSFWELTDKESSMQPTSEIVKTPTAITMGISVD